MTQIWATARSRLAAPPRWGWGLLAVVALFAVIGSAMAAQAGEVLPGTRLDDTDVGGLGASDLHQVVQDLVTQRQQATIEAQVEGQTFTFTPGVDGFPVDVDAVVSELLDAGRDGMVTALASSVASLLGASRDVALPDVTNPAVVDAFLDRVQAAVDIPPFPGSISIDPDVLTVSSTSPADGLALDREAAGPAIVALIGEPAPAPVQLPTVVVPVATDIDDLVAVAAEARAALQQAVTLTTPEGGSVTLTPHDLAPLLEATEVADGLALSVDRDLLATALEPHLDRLEIPATNATFEVTSDLPTFDNQGDVTWEPVPADLTVVPGQTGKGIDMAAAATQLAGLLLDGTVNAEIDRVEIRPELTAEELEGLGVDHLIGTFTTYHACCQNRVRNIQRMADLVDGVVLRPGEEFSINEFVGKRTIENGFVADGAIFNGEIRPEIGGGVSQFATTTFNAAFFAGIPILDHRAHSLYISRYPRGREATLNFPSIDLRIRNDTEHGLYIHTSYTPRSITVSLFGDNGGRRVSAVMGQPYGYRGYEERRREDPSLPAGTERVSQSGTQGYNVKVLRLIDIGGEVTTEEFVTVYSPRPAIILVGSGPPAPEPTPDPTQGPPPSGSPAPSPPPASEQPTPDPTPTA